MMSSKTFPIDSLPREVRARHIQRRKEIFDERFEQMKAAYLNSDSEEKQLYWFLRDENYNLAWDVYIPETVERYRTRKAELESHGLPQVKAGRLAWEEVAIEFDGGVDHLRANAPNPYPSYNGPEYWAEGFWDSYLEETSLPYWRRQYYMDDQKAAMAEKMGKRTRDEWLVRRRKQLESSGEAENHAAVQALSELYGMMDTVYACLVERVERTKHSR